MLGHKAKLQEMALASELIAAGEETT